MRAFSAANSCVGQDSLLLEGGQVLELLDPILPPAAGGGAAGGGAAYC